jgi:hypothetical protein
MTICAGQQASERRDTFLCAYPSTPNMPADALILDTQSQLGYNTNKWPERHLRKHL